MVSEANTRQWRKGVCHQATCGPHGLPHLVKGGGNKKKRKKDDLNRPRHRGRFNLTFEITRSPGQARGAGLIADTSAGSNAVKADGMPFSGMTNILNSNGRA